MYLLNVVHPVFSQELRSMLSLSVFVGICKSNVTVNFVRELKNPQSARQPTIPIGVLNAGKSDPVLVHYECIIIVGMLVRKCMCGRI